MNFIILQSLLLSLIIDRLYIIFHYSLSRFFLRDFRDCLISLWPLFRGIPGCEWFSSWRVVKLITSIVKSHDPHGGHSLQRRWRVTRDSPDVQMDFVVIWIIVKCRVWRWRIVRRLQPFGCTFFGLPPQSYTLPALPLSSLATCSSRSPAISKSICLSRWRGGASLFPSIWLVNVVWIYFGASRQLPFLPPPPPPSSAQLSATISLSAGKGWREAEREGGEGVKPQILGASRRRACGMYFYVSTCERGRDAKALPSHGISISASDRTPDVERVFGSFRRIALGSARANHFRRA